MVLKFIGSNRGPWSMPCKGGGTDMLRKYVTGMVALVGLSKYVTDFQKFTSEEIGKNVKYVTKFLNLIVCWKCL